jgi:plasmid stabilization system protein ParE
MNIRLLEPAQQELDEAIAWYADQAPEAIDTLPPFLQTTLPT